MGTKSVVWGIGAIRQGEGSPRCVKEFRMVDPQQQLDLESLARDGVTLSAAAKRLGLSRAVIQQMATKHSLSFLTHGEATAHRLRVLVSQGKTPEEICIELGRGLKYLRKVARDNGIALPRKNRIAPPRKPRCGRSGFRPTPVPAETQTEILRLFDAGVSMFQMGSILGLGRLKIKTVVEEAKGLPLSEAMLAQKGVFVGSVFGPLTVTAFHRKGPRTLILCKCKCGSETYQTQGVLKRPRLTFCNASCGLPRTNWVDRTGERRGLWTLLEYLGGNLWLCRCDCGTTKEVDRTNLLSGRSTRCSVCSPWHGNSTNLQRIPLASRSVGIADPP